MGKNTNVAKIESELNKLKLYSESTPVTLSMKISGFDSDRDLKRYVKSVEKMVRNCPEFREWKRYLSDVLGYTKCILTEEKSDECPIEIHHHIPTLFILCKSIVLTKLEDEKEFSTFDIAEEVVKLHYENRIGYACIVSTLHKKHHNGFLNIPIEYINGDYGYFLKNYVIDDGDLKSLRKKTKSKLNNCKKVKWSKNNYPGLNVVNTDPDQLSLFN